MKYEDQLDGFGRKIYSNGHQFIGWLEYAHLHGYAQVRYTNSVIEEGIYRYHILEQPANSYFGVENDFTMLKVDFSQYIILANIEDTELPQI